MRIILPLLCSFVLTLASCASAPKVAPPSFAGDWEVVVENTPMGTIPGTLSINKAEDGYSGTFDSQGSSYRLKSVNATETGLQVTFYFPDQDLDVDIDFRGAPTSNTLSGQTLGQYTTTATRVIQNEKDQK